MKGEFTRIITCTICLGLACLFLTGSGLAGTTATMVINLDCQPGASNRVITVPTNSVTRQMNVLRGIGRDFFLDVTLQDGAVWGAGAPAPVTGSLTFPGLTVATYTVLLMGAPEGTATATYAVVVAGGTPTVFPTGPFTTTGLAITDINNVLGTEGIS